MSESIEVLRDRLATRDAELKKLRVRLKKTKELASKPAVKASISDIQKRYLSAVADLESKKLEEASKPIEIKTKAVSSLANRFNKGIDGKKIQRTNINVKGDVSNTKKTFSKIDSLSSNGPNNDITINTQKPIQQQQPSELLVEDADGLPSWAKNQQKLMIRKENARSSIHDVDVKELQENVLDDNISKYNSLSKDDGGVSLPKGNVKAALAIWGKTDEEDAKVLAKKKEEEEKAIRLKNEKEEQERRLAINKAIEKFSALSLNDLKNEPENNDIELLAFLQRKIHLVDVEIRSMENEIQQAELEIGH